MRSFAGGGQTDPAGKRAAVLPYHDQPVVDEAERGQLLSLMAEYFRLIGCTQVKARLPEHTPPAIVVGTLEDHRPDLTCLQPNARQMAILLEAVTPQALKDPSYKNRWTLLGSVARTFPCELHFVVRRWTPNGPVAPALRSYLERMGIRCSRIWEV